jgi:hypothetical protein
MGRSQGSITLVTPAIVRWTPSDVLVSIPFTMVSNEPVGSSTELRLSTVTPDARAVDLRIEFHAST